MIARTIHLKGLVQGVSFRAWTKDLADVLGVTGWARNLRDGSLEAHLEGDEAAVLALIERMKTGPSGARVDGSKVSNSKIEHCPTFGIRR